MSNVAFVTIKGGAIKGQKLDPILEKILTEKWGSLLTLHRVAPSTYWEVGREDLINFNIWLQNPRRVSLKPGGWQLTGWVLTYVQYSIAAHVKGICSDEGVREHWIGDISKVDTYEMYFKFCHGGACDERELEARFQEHMDFKLFRDQPRELFG